MSFFPRRISATEIFEKDLKRLKKRYRSILKDLAPLQLKLERGETPGERVQGTSTYAVYKERLRNSDNNKGESGGYRIIYYLRLEDEIILVTIYSKSDTADILPHQILAFIEEFEKNNEAETTETEDDQSGKKQFDNE